MGESYNQQGVEVTLPFKQPQRRVINVEHRNWVNQKRAEKK